MNDMCAFRFWNTLWDSGVWGINDNQGRQLWGKLHPCTIRRHTSCVPWIQGSVSLWSDSNKTHLARVIVSLFKDIYASYRKHIVWTLLIILLLPSMGSWRQWNLWPLTSDLWDEDGNSQCPLTKFQHFLDSCSIMIIILFAFSQVRHDVLLLLSVKLCKQHTYWRFNLVINPAPSVMCCVFTLIEVVLETHLIKHVTVHDELSPLPG